MHLFVWGLESVFVQGFIVSFRTSSQTHTPSRSLSLSAPRSPPSTSARLPPLESSTTTLESLSRTLRSYAAPFAPFTGPTSKQGATQSGKSERKSGKGQGQGLKNAPYPPAVRRVEVLGSGYGGGGGTGGGGGGKQEWEREYEEYDERGYGYPASAVASGASSSRVRDVIGVGVGVGGSREVGVGLGRDVGRSVPVPLPVPERQRAWAGEGEGVSRRREAQTETQGARVGGLALSRTLRRGSSPLRPREGEGDDGRDRRGEYGGGERTGEEGDVERVVWARWEVLGRRPLLLIAYARALQVWDTGNLASVAEVLHVDFKRGEAAGEWVGDGSRKVVAVVQAVVSTEGGESPVLSLLLETQDGKGVREGVVVRYSLGEERVLGRVRVEGGVPMAMECGVGGVLVVSTANPAALHILAPGTLKTLHTITSSELALFSTPPFANAQQQSPVGPSSYTSSHSQSYDHSYPGQAQQNRPLYGGGSDGEGGEDQFTSPSERAELPHPVFALSHRLLAYAIPSSSTTSYYTNTTSGGASSTLRRKESSLSSASSGTGSSVPGASPSSYTSQSPFAAVGGLGGIAIPKTQAELGSAALKVGGGLVRGMRWVGGVALEGVRNRIAGEQGSVGVPLGAANGRQVQGHGQGNGSGSGAANGQGGIGSFFSRSAPTGTLLGPAGVSEEEERKRRRFSDIQAGGGHMAPPSTGGSAGSRVGGGKGYFIRVVDLGALLGAIGGMEEEGGLDVDLEVVAEFVGSRSQPIARLGWARDGCSLYVAPRDGYVVKVFRIRPSPSVSVPGSAAPSSPTSQSGGGKGLKRLGGSEVVPLYELRRGRVTAAVIEDVRAAGDGRWTGVVTRNRTLHVFATNPLGGRSSILSHLDGRVRTPEAEGALEGKVELKPVVRLYGSRGGQGEEEGGGRAAMAFVFVEGGVGALPPSLAPVSGVGRKGIPISPTRRGDGSVGSGSSPPLPVSPVRGARGGGAGAGAPRNVQDVLLFDSATGVLHLQRVTVEARAKAEGYGSGIVGAASAAFVGGTSLSLGSLGKSLTSTTTSAIGMAMTAANASGSVSGGSGVGGSGTSVPGMGAAGPLSVSSSVSSSSVHAYMRGRERGAQLREDVYELVGRVGAVSNWDLRKGRGWPEVRKGLLASSPLSERRRGLSVGGSDEWLAQAELSTFHNPRTGRSRSIYLTHQVSFHTLGEDYHALVRKYRLDVDGDKIEVRKEVPIQAFTTVTTSASHPSIVGASGSSESFVEGFSPTRASARGSYPPGAVSSSFDEPLASALQGELEYQPPAAVLPMYPNGVAGSRASAIRNSIPIRRLGDGVSEGLGRIRRGVAVRSPRLASARSGEEYGGAMAEHDVLLEFDEEVDDFMAPRVVNPEGAGLLDEDVVGRVDEEIWAEGWDNQDRMAVEEAEQFHTISTAGYVDEGVVPPPLASPPIPAQKKKGGKRRK
ncbi:hypothetical protein D9611_012185 [Ephemerocybe angulata]|uniref:BCAS3 domain-containing protein n=1 Tax=Ephemerocybe angulata TaxID=980116 RepID=A0A8H5C5J7_9AGAR|nr:hypothetical protein D9611_012185 [Tulosesus angulatus]